MILRCYQPTICSFHIWFPVLVLSGKTMRADIVLQLIKMLVMVIKIETKYVVDLDRMGLKPNFFAIREA